MDLETLGYFIYMDEHERAAKQQQEENTEDTDKDNN